MLDIKFVRDNPDAVKENIKKKFQDAKLPLVDEVIEKDAKYRECLKEVESLKAARNKLSKANGPLFGQLKKCTDEAQKAALQAQIDANNAAVKADADKMAELEKEEEFIEDMETLAEGMKLLQYDYLGGHGTRGYGKIKFSGLNIKSVLGDVHDNILNECKAYLKDVEE